MLFFMPETEPNIETPYSRVPPELKEYDQWVNWSPDKTPLNPHSLRAASVTDPSSWSSFEEAVATGRPVGFVLTPDDPYTVVDLDHVVDPRRRYQVTEEAQAILRLLNGYAELSPSRTGLHIWCRNELPFSRRTKGIEAYSSGRYMTVTGLANPRAPQEIPDRTNELQELLRRYFKPNIPSPEQQAVPIDDEEIWRRLFGSKSGHIFTALFNGDTSVCYNDHSRAVIFLANQLARMTNLDAGRMKRLLYQTRLVNEKWQTRRGDSTWIDYQILEAIRYVAGRK